MTNFVKIPLVLALVTMLTSGLLMVSEELTYEKIAEQKRMLLLNSLKQLIPNKLHNNNLLESTIELNQPELLGHRNVQFAYVGRLDNKLSVVAIPVTSRIGYSGDIDLIVGIKSNGEITVVKILEQHETPGLGDIIESHKSDWLLQFPKKSLKNPTEQNWSVKRDGGDFDQITGATITPRAVVKAIKQALDFFHTNRQLFEIKGNNNISNNNNIEKKS